MRRDRLLLCSSLILGLAAAACSSDTDTPGPQPAPDAGFATFDASAAPDVGVPDTGPADAGFEPCIFDKGGLDNRGCDQGMVCNLAMDPPQCVPGTTCASNADCRPCSDLQSPQECGHGFPLTAWCDPSHGNVCVRSKSPCEPCQTDEDCGFTHPLFGSEIQECVDYGDGEKFCSRPSSNGCPDGFEANSDGQCVRSAGCEPVPVICPPNDDPIPDCSGTGQICAGETCPGTGGARCSTNDQPGALGICIGFCQSNNDCPPSLPVCNTRNGICISGCAKGTCPAGQVCHLDGFCATPCTDNEFCETDSRYGGESYCNTGSPPQPPPRYFKTYHDPNSCQRLGCEMAVDCGGAGRVCDPTAVPPACVEGCFVADDCRAGEICKDAPPPPLGQAYSREQCRAFPNVPEDNETLIGTCCNPGCLDRDLQCGLNEWCCGEPDSPYEDPDHCLTITSTGGRQAQPGECFPMMSTASPAGAGQFCAGCSPLGGFNQGAMECSGGNRANLPGPDGMTPGWYPGLNTDPNVNNGQPFREMEFCFTVAQGFGFCGTTCDPDADDKGCPGRQSCNPVTAPCCQDADCGGLTCAGADCNNPDPMMANAGRCQCGENGVPSVACPGTYTLIDQTVPFPRCVEQGTEGDMFCVAAYNCQPPAIEQMDGFPYPPGCFQ